jgi:hypothetical protein
MPGLMTYRDGDTFPGVIGRTTEESSPAWPTPVLGTWGTEVGAGLNGARFRFVDHLGNYLVGLAAAR